MADDHSHSGIPPPVFLVVAIALGVVLDLLAPLSVLPNGLAIGFGVALGVPAVLLNWWSAVTMLRARTSLTGLGSSTVVLKSGPFQISRNPIYVSMLLLAGAVALAVNSAWGLMLLMPLFLVLYFSAIIPEERYLERKFGEEYRDYCARVRRWV